MGSGAGRGQPSVTVTLDNTLAQQKLKLGSLGRSGRDKTIAKRNTVFGLADWEKNTFEHLIEIKFQIKRFKIP